MIFLSKFWSKLLKQTDPYIPGEQPKTTKVIKLNTNENPYPPSPKVLDAIKQATDESLRLYPSPTADDLRETVASYYGLKDNQIFIGNGSDEVLAFSFMAFFNPGEKILFPDISYSFYPVYAKLFQIDYELVELTGDFTIPVEQFFNAKGGVIFPNPNAPTGVLLSLNDVELILQNNKEKVVIIDEAYIDFGGESAVQLVDQYDNLLVIQTLSKSRSLAGMRVGLAVGNENLITGLNHIKNSVNSYTLDRLALVAAKASFEDEVYFKEVCETIIQEREKAASTLRALGFHVLQSQANFLFASHPKVDAEFLYEQLKERNIFIRFFKKPKIDQYVRITVGNRADMQEFFDVLKEIV
ncbi:histidinol-phosphate transaminase [Salirhabdus euzebyi]|uniref:histidinol-phosphate transaminase n=1 Tax=Salirhabdus euzebyi TaxID=394506 RepID=UPI0031FBFF36